MSTVLDFFFSTNPNQLLGTVINLAIVMIGVIASIQMIRAFAQLSESRRKLAEFTEEVKGVTDPGALLAVSRRIPEQHLVARRVQMLHDLRVAGADIEPGALAALAIAELDREVKWARWAASTVVLFGLAGTLMGLSVAVTRARPMLAEIVSGPEATQAVIDTFSGLGTAFSTTLMGILWAVILGLSVGRFRGAQGAYLQRLESFSLVRLVPYFRTSTALAMVDAARTLSSLEQKLAKELNEIVVQVRLQGSHLIKTVEDSLESVVKETRERGVALTGTVDSSFATLTEELRTGNAWLLERFESTHQAVQRMIGEPGPDDSSLAENMRVLKAGVESMNRAAERMNQMAPAIEEALARQVDRQSRDLHDTMHAYTGHLNQAAQRQDTLLDDGFRRLENGVSGFGDVLLNQLQEHDRSLLGGVKASTQQIADALRDQTAAQEKLGEALATLGAAAGQLRNHSSAIHEATEALQDASTRLHAHLDNLGRKTDRHESMTAVPAVGGATQPPRPSTPAASVPPRQEPGASRVIPPMVPESSPVGPGAPTVELPAAPREPAPIPGSGARLPEPARPTPMVSGPVKKPGFFARLFGRG